MPDNPHALHAQIRQIATEVLTVEAAAVTRMAAAVDESFELAVRLMLDCPASVLTAGVGKAGHVASKIAATLASTGTPSHFISASDAVHGDAGAIRAGDIVLIFSASGESDEIVRLLSVVVHQLNNSYNLFFYPKNF